MADWKVDGESPLSTEWRIDKAPAVPETPALSSGGEVLKDVGESGARGLAKGTAGAIGAPGDIPDMIGNAVEYLAKKGLKATGMYPDAAEPTWAGIAKENRDLSKGSNILPRGADIEKEVIEPATGADLSKKAKTIPGKYTQSVMEAVPQAVYGGGGLIPRAIGAVGSGIGSEALGSAFEGDETLEPWARAIGGTVGALGQHAVTPLGIPADRAKPVAYLESKGITPTAADRTGNTPLKYAEDHLGQAWGGGGNPAHKVLEDYTTAALKTTGIPGKIADADYLNKAHKAIGGEIGALGDRNTLIRDQQFTKDVHDAYSEYSHSTPPSEVIPRVDKIYEDLIQFPPTLPGKQYVGYRSEWADRARKANEDPHYQHFLNSVNKAMDDAMERSVAVINPGDLGAFKDARKRYRNLILIEDAVKSGEWGARGYVTPERLRSALETNEYVRGMGDLGPLAKAGKAVLNTKPDSGTTARLATHTVPAVLASLLGHGDPETVMALVGGPAAAGRIINSRPVQNYLGNNVFDKSQMVSPLDAAVRASLASRAHGQSE